jgi:hypothetical protein
MLAKGVDSPIGLIRRSIDVRPSGFDKVDQTALETQPLALERVGRVALGADLADQLEKSRGLSHAAI